METPFTWTVDLEHDWGGRTNGIQGITEGLPRILEIFRSYNIKALFFVSTELAAENRGRIRDLLDRGHDVGSHGHFHIKYKDAWRAEADRQISFQLLSVFRIGTFEYRAPRFYYQSDSSMYSYRNNHISVLKWSWWKRPIPVQPVFYIHPFDIVSGGHAPNTFSRILYSRPDRVYKSLIKLAIKHPWRKRLT